MAPPDDHRPSPLPRVSVITVTRNLIDAGRQQRFRAAVDCVQAQTCRDIEHVIQDGASTDGTQDLIAGLAAQAAAQPGAVPIRWTSERDANLYDGMNKAIAGARGRYVIFLNSDDLLGGPDTLGRLLDGAAEGSRFVYGSNLRTDDTGNRRHLKRTSTHAIFQRMPFSHNAVLLDRQMLVDLDGHDTQFPVAADYDLFFRMIASGATGVQVDACVSVFHTGGLTADDERVAADYAAVWRKHFAAHLDMSRYSEEDLKGWYRAGAMPVAVTFALWRAYRGVPQMRRAAAHSLGKSLRRALQPWRRARAAKGN